MMTQPAGLTAQIAAQAAHRTFEHLPASMVALAKQCLLDWLGVTLAGSREPLVETLLAQSCSEGGRPQATAVGHAPRVNRLQAALLNGTASHALDYDDVNMAIIGHPTAPVLPAALALAEVQGASGQALIAAFVTGYEVECRVGLAGGLDHYHRGWHATATLGTFGAAAAAGWLLGLQPAQMATAFGIAGTQAAGLKSMFGTACKPFQVGKAAANGLLAAELAQRGFSSRAEVIECEQGFGDTQSRDFQPARALLPDDRFLLADNLFKYHAACYLTHSSIEAVAGLRQAHRLTPEQVKEVVLHVDAGHLKVCAIPAPTTGLESKFSLRHAAALALTGIDTAALGSYSDALANRTDLVALRERVRLETSGSIKGSAALVELITTQGAHFQQQVDVGVPLRDLDLQWQKLAAKFRALTLPILGAERSEILLALVGRLETLPSLDPLFALLSASDHSANRM